MDNIEVATKATQGTSEVPWGNIKLLDASVVKLPVDPKDVATASRSGQNLIITLKSGEQVTIGDFFVVNAAGEQSTLVFEGQDGFLWQANYGEPFTGFTFTELSVADELLLAGAAAAGSTPGWLLAALSLAGLGAGVAAGSGGGGGGGGNDGGSVSPPVDPIDTTAPAAAFDLLFAASGASLSGKAEANAQVIVRDAQGNIVGTGTVDADGNFLIDFTTPQANGESLVVTVIDAAGNVSPPVAITAPDITAPGAPGALAISADGATLTGTGEPGATVVVRGATGGILGTAVVAADGSFSLTLAPPQINGEIVSVTQTDAAGNLSLATSLGAPDLTPDNTAPDPATGLAISANGAVLTGKGEVGAIINVTDAGGNVLASGTVDTAGNFRLTLAPAQTNGQALNVTVQDASGNVSLPAAVQAPDIDAPVAPSNLTLDAGGSLLSGTTEAGASVVVRDPLGAVIGTGIAGADGSFQITLTNPQLNGATLEVVATDAVGNVSLPAQFVSADVTPPAAVADLIIGADGLWAGGSGEAGCTVTITDAAGQLLGTAQVNAFGRFFMRFSVRVASNEELTAFQTDPSGNVSPLVNMLTPDNVGPGTPDNLALTADGLTLTGTGAAGDAVRVLDSQGNVLGTGSVNPDGTFSIVLNAPQTNGQVLNVIATDPVVNEDSVPILFTAADSTAPAAVSGLSVGANGTTVSGQGEPGAQITVRDEQGNVIGTGTVNQAGNFSVAISPAQVDGEVLGVTQADAAGNVSPSLAVTAPDISPGVDLSQVAISADGTLVTGRGEPGDTVSVSGPGGVLLGSGVVGGNGIFSVTLNVAQTNGQTLTVGQRDAAGNTSPDASVTAPDIDAPATPSGLLLDASGTVLAGTAEAGSTVTVRDVQGNVLGSAVTAADGTFQVNLGTPQNNGQQLTVSAADTAGNNSLPAAFPAPDTSAPGAVTNLQVSADGLTLTGQGEPGASVIITNATGAVIGTAVVGANGSFSVPLTAAAAEGSVLGAIQTDAAGNPSVPATVSVPDAIGPATPGNLAVSFDGLQLTGTASAGNTINVYNAQGQLLGTAVAGSDGSFNVALSAAQTNGEVLDVIASDSSGEVSVPVEVTATDSTAPGALSNVLISSNGLVVTGNGEVGAAVLVRGPDGAVLATGTVSANGTFTVTLPVALVNGQLLQAVQVDTAGNSSNATDVTAPDRTPPAALAGLAVSADGFTVTGSGEANATVTVLGANGAPLGTAVVAANGLFSVTLGTAQINGQLLSLTQSDVAGNLSSAVSVQAPDVQIPTAPGDLVINAAGNALTGSGEIGAIVRVRDAGGVLLGEAQVGSDGRFQVAIAPPQNNGQLLEVNQADAAGNTSVSSPFTALDVTAPGPLTGVSLSNNGLTVSGLGEPGATVIVRDAQNVELARATVGSSGAFVVILPSAQLNGQSLNVNQLDPAANPSAVTVVIARDITAPNAPANLGLDASGTVLTGSSEAGAAISVSNAQGVVVSTGVAGPDGSFTLTLAPPQLNGENLRVVASDAAGNISPTSILPVNDSTPPAAVTNLSISPDGLSLAGKGEAGATLSVTDAAGQSVGTGTVDGNGNFVIILNRAGLSTDVLSVIATDVAGNPSLPASINGPDGLGPVVPGNLQVTLDGAELLGTGTIGSMIVVTNALNVELGRGTVDAQGNFLVLLNTPQRNGEVLTVVASNNNQLSIPGQVQALDTTVPDPLTNLAVNGDGTLLTGLGEAGATVTVRTAAGDVLGTTLVGANGAFSFALTPALINAQPLTVTQTDGGNNVSPDVVVSAPDLTAPDAPATLSLNSFGTVLSGQGEALARVEIRTPQGTLIGVGNVDATGNFQITLTASQTSGAPLQVNLIDAAGNVSAPGLLASLDTTAPLAVTNLAINAAGTTLTGKGEIGATVSVVNAANAVVGTGVVAANGTFTVLLTTPQANGQALEVLQRDLAGNASVPVPVAAPDITAPGALSFVTINGNGSIVTGLGEAGATVRILDANGTLLSSAVVAANGTFTVALNPPQANLQLLTVNQVDAGSNVSPSFILTAPDLQAPGAPSDLSLTPQGGALTGRAEPGSVVTVIVSDAQGNVLGTATVAANGTFQVNLNSPQNNGETLLVTSTDAAGNVSSTTTIVAADTTAPNPVTALVVSPDGGLLAGVGEAGATVTVRTSDGTSLGNTTVGANGTFTVTLNPSAAEGAALTVTQADPAGNTSAGASVTAPDTNGPDQPTGLLLTADGLQLSGQGDVGNTITVRDLQNNLLGSAVVDVDGNFVVALSSPQTNGQTLVAVATDTLGGVSVPGQLVAGDTTAPVPLTNLAISTDGTQVTGRGEVGATVTITGPGNVVLGTSVVGITGAFAVPLSAAQLNGQLLNAVQRDAAGNVSDPGTVTALDRTAPDAPTGLVLSSDGAVLTGTGEPNASVLVTSGSTVVGSGTVLLNGTFQIQMATPQLNGQALAVTLVDPTGNVSQATNITAVDSTAPLPLTDVVVNSLGSTVVGRGEAGATVTVTDANGLVLGTAVVGATGSFTFALSPALTNGEVLSLTQADPTGNVSPVVTATALDASPPALLTNVSINPDTGALVTGNGEPGATVTVKNAAGFTLGTGLVAANGEFIVTLTPPQLNNQVLSVVQADPPGNISLPSQVIAPDLTPPEAPVALSLNTAGTVLSGQGEVGTLATVRTLGGDVLGTATVAPDGTFQVALNAAQLDGQQLLVTLADARPNVSGTTGITAPDITAPVAPTIISLDATGMVLTGTGLAGLRLNVSNNLGISIGSGTVDTDGAFRIMLTTPQINGETVRVVQLDAAGNASLPATTLALDLQAPAAPVVSAISLDGTVLTGVGEANATIVVRSATGVILGSDNADANGNFSITIAPQLNAQILSVTQADAANNVSVAASFQADDRTLPDPLTGLRLSTDGVLALGTGEPGATVIINGLLGELGRGTVNPDGTFSITLNTPQINFQLLSGVQVDAAGNVSAGVDFNAVDLTPPAAPVVSSLTTGGTVLNGTTEALATVTVTSALGAVVGTAVADGDGNFVVTLTAPQTNGELLTLTAADPRGNVSASVPYAVLDTTIPLPVTDLAVSVNGLNLSGHGEANAVVTVSLDGIVLGTATADANGLFLVPLNVRLLGNEVVEIVQSDAAGNTSVGVTLTVPLGTPPSAPTGLAISADGLLLSGQTVAGATVIVRDLAGTELGRVVATGSTFEVSLNAAQNNGQLLQVTATEGPLVSVPALFTSIDTVAPGILTQAAINSLGTIVTGKGEVGANVSISASTGVVGTGQVAANGTFTIVLTTPQNNGGLLSAIQTDLSGNVSTSIPLTAPDITPPPAPVDLTLSTDGLRLSGNGEAGTLATVYTAAGVSLGSATVLPGGSFTVALSAAQLNGQALTVRLSDAAGNTSPATPYLAVDITSPAALTATLGVTGAVVTGTGEAGARVTVQVGTTVLGQAIVDGAGNYVVNLNAPQLNGQILSVLQTDAAGLSSPISFLTATDVQAPSAPTNLQLAGGVLLSGAGEIGAVVNVFSAGVRVGGGTVGPLGTFAVTVNPPQLNGGQLTVTLTDAVGNVSAAAPLGVADTTPPAAPTAVIISASGTTVSGRGEAGASVVVRLGTTTLGTGTVAADGTFAVTLTAAQINTQTLNVTLTDTAGNPSASTPVVAPDLTPPPAATALVVSADGLSLNGVGEVGATVTVRGPAGTVLGSTVIGVGGTFTVGLSAAQINAEVLKVTLNDVPGNVSPTASVTAPDIDVNAPVVANNDVAQATVNIQPVTASGTFYDTGTTLLLGQAKGYAFTVAGDTTTTGNITITTSSLLGLLTSASFALQVKNAAGDWVNVGSGTNPGLLDLLGLGTNTVTARLPVLEAGDYRLLVGSSLINVLGTLTTRLDLTTTSLTQFTATAGDPVEGNVITGAGSILPSAPDQTGPDNGAVLQVLKGGVFVTAATGVQGTTVQGAYGQLVIDATGKYTYTANGSLNSVGKVEVFQYQLVHPNGLVSTANLYVRIDSPQATETWNDANLAANAVVVDATNDVAATSVTLVGQPSTEVSTIDRYTSGLLGGNKSIDFTVAPNAVTDLTFGITAGGLSLLSGMTLTLQKQQANGTYVTVSSTSQLTVVDVGGAAFGVKIAGQTGGNYRLILNNGGLNLGTTYTVGLKQEHVSTVNFVVGSATQAVGNLYSDTGSGVDVPGSIYTSLTVLTANGSYVHPGANGVIIAGLYGSLLVHADGSYAYTANLNQSSTVVGKADVFTYHLNHPNGDIDSATLTVSLNDAASLPATTSFARVASLETDTSADHSALLATDQHTLDGTAGNDTLDGVQGGSLTFQGHEGNDTIVIYDQAFASVDGGTGVDTLKWNGGDADIDLSNLASRINNIDIIDLNHTSKVNLTLSLSDLLSVTDSTTDKLLIQGDSQDTVHMTGATWAEGAAQVDNGVQYNVYTAQEDPSHHLWVQNGISVV